MKAYDIILQSADLMLCDYVQHQGQIYLVEELTQHDITLYNPIISSDKQLLIVNKVEPIQITSDYLQESGFKFSQKTTKTRLYQTAILTASHNHHLQLLYKTSPCKNTVVAGVGKQETRYPNVRYLHQLQHIITQLHLNLTIKNPFT